MEQSSVIIGGQNLFKGDATDFLAEIENDSVRLVISSPPYDMGKTYEGKQGTLNSWTDNQEYILKECFRTLMPGGSVCWQTGMRIERRRDGTASVIPLDAIIYPVMIKMGFIPRNRIIWTFGHGLHCRNRFSGRHETMLWMTKGDGYVFNLDSVRIPSKYPGKTYFKGPRKGQLSGNPLGKNPSDVWDIVNIKAGHGEKTGHPCQFPLELARRAILAFTNPEDTVVDPYTGSGTTLHACMETNRIGYGSEINPDYCEITTRRLQAAGHKASSSVSQQSSGSG